MNNTKVPVLDSVMITEEPAITVVTEQEVKLLLVDGEKEKSDVEYDYGLD